MSTANPTHFDNQLLQQAQAGDKLAVTQICETFRPLLRSVAGRFRGVSYEDAVQEGCVALLQAIRLYDAERGIPFVGFVARKVHGDVRTAMRREWHYTQRTAFLSQRGEEENQASQEDTQSHQQWLQNPDGEYGTVEWKEVMRQAGLTAREAWSLQEGLKGRSAPEMAKDYKVSPETVRTWRKRAFRKIRKALREV